MPNWKPPTASRPRNCASKNRTPAPRLPPCASWLSAWKPSPANTPPTRPNWRTPSMPPRKILLGAMWLSLLTLPACSTTPPWAPPVLSSQRCAPLTRCQLPPTAPSSNRQLAQALQLQRQALEVCAAKVNATIECQDHD
ncbi:Rz1-like lysis system protein LysC [Chromobacterium sp. Beijing]|uniref:Rz1-like lysis system protein LysC n=1 Tax=Chromobacterium sp. Beijing TaxID=2735795 RepID=UPI00351D73EB